MFSGLRTNSIFYVLDKSDKPTLKIGQVTSVSNPVPKFGAAAMPYNPSTETTVDVSAKFNGEQMEFKQLPSNLSIANSGAMVVSESREAMISEVEAMRRTSDDVLQSVEYHKNVVKSCDEILGVLNPQIAKEKEQEAKIGQLESKVSGMESTLYDIKGMLTKALGASGTTKK